jgi:hypothetical protein
LPAFVTVANVKVETDNIKAEIELSDVNVPQTGFLEINGLYITFSRDEFEDLRDAINHVSNSVAM